MSTIQQLQEWTPALKSEGFETLAGLIEKLALEKAEQQEPVAYWVPKTEQFCIADPRGRPFAKAWEPLYTRPPKRQPLTAWLPIETAPKDGTWVIVCDDKGNVHPDYWRGGQIGYWPKEIPPANNVFWMPLPDAPAADGIKKGGAA